MLVALCALYFIFPDFCKQSIDSGIEYCLHSLIPSVFPFIVLGNLIAASDISSGLSKALSGAFEKVFHLSENLFVPYLTGLICGYPAGCIAVCREYEMGNISQKEAEYGIVISTNASPAFCIGIIGGVIGSFRAGIIIYLLQIPVNIIVAQFGKRCPITKKARKNSTEEPFASLFCKGITSAIYPSVSICSFVIFFSVISGIIRLIFLKLSLPKALIPFALSFIELTGAVGCSYELPVILKTALCAFALGFGGLCIHFQLKSVYSAYGIKCKAFFAKKLTSAVLLSALSTSLYFFACC